MTRSLSSPKSVERNQTRAVLLVDVAALAQALDRPLDPALVVEATPRSSRRRNARRGGSRLASIPSRTRPAAQCPTIAAASAPSAVAAAQTSSGTARASSST